ncbi:MAG: aromatic ring-hydroxylating dioxygenase subunit alpha [Solirubrobacterales bacterium]|nr:aromatic ring-hydroxylating dioxygenase subunit alpha [Solirubrobacterales bacterium]
MNGPAFAEGLLAEADAAIGAGRTLPARWYTAPAVFDLELREIFGRTWTPFGIQHGLDEDGDYATDLVSGVPVLMTRSRGRVRAFLNACRHRGHPVAEGRGRADSFRCRYHGWTYDPNGALVDAPRGDREPEFDRSGLCLPEVGAAEWGPLKLVNPDPSAPAFDAAFASLIEIAGRSGLQLDSLRCRATESRVIQCNWKLLYENFAECYHCATVHPAFAAVHGVEPHEYEVEIHDRFIHSRSPRREPDAVDAWEGFAAWPGWSLARGDDPSVVFATTLAPEAVGRTRVITHVFAGDDVREATIERELAGWWFATYEEDGAVCSAVQRSLVAGAFEQGPILLDSESAIRDLQVKLRDSLAGAGGSDD